MLLESLLLNIEKSVDNISSHQVPGTHVSHLVDDPALDVSIILSLIYLINVLVVCLHRNLSLERLFSNLIMSDPAAQSLMSTFKASKKEVFSLRSQRELKEIKT